MNYLNKLFSWIGSDGMSHLIISAIIAVVLNLLLAGCKATEVVHVPTIHTIETIIHDTIVEVHMPEHYTERETLDTIRELSNPFAYSRASVSQGRLTHSLGIVEGATVKERVQIVETIIRDSIAYPVEVEVIREVPRKRGWWETSLLWVGGITILSVAGFILIKIFRARA